MTEIITRRSDEEIAARNLWIQTMSKGTFNLSTPRLSRFCLLDVIVGLARTKRFMGQTKAGADFTIPSYSVLQHCDLVMQIVKATRPDLFEKHGLLLLQYAFLHDGHEAPLGDQNSQFKKLLEMWGVLHLLRALAREFDAIIHEMVGLPWPIDPEIAAAIKKADLIALATERAQLMPHMEWEEKVEDPFPMDIVPLGEHDAIRFGMAQAQKLGFDLMARNQPYQPMPLAA
jgi:hypothetical protein